MTGHITSFLSKQHAALSIGMLIDFSYRSQLLVQFIFFISALALSPTLGAKLCCILATHATGCRVKLEVKTETRHM